MKVALVTGAGTGIGKAIAIDIANAGAVVLTCGRRKELLDQTISAFPDSAEGKAYAADLTDPPCHAKISGRSYSRPRRHRYSR